MAAVRKETEAAPAAPRRRRATQADDAGVTKGAPWAPTKTTGFSKGATSKVAATLEVTSTHAGEDATLVSRSTAGLTTATHAEHPGHTAHPRGHDVDQQVKSLAHIYTPWANVRANGSGIVALAAWARRLESEGKLAASEAASDIGEFIRGLVHR